MNSLFYPLQRMALHIPGTGPAHDPSRAHLYIVINNPCANNLNLVVPVSSAHPNCDRTCLLTSGHEFIKHESHALYSRADTVQKEKLCASVEAGIIQYRGLFGEVEFAAVVAGILISPHTRPRVKRYFRENCL